MKSVSPLTLGFRGLLTDTWNMGAARAKNIVSVVFGLLPRLGLVLLIALPLHIAAADCPPVNPNADSFEYDLLRSLCGSGAINPQQVTSVMQWFSSNDGKKRVQCGLPG